VIYHGNRIKIKDRVAPEERRAALDLLDAAGGEIPVVESYLPVNFGSSALPGTSAE
jgi:hypothetical protein